VLQDWNDGRIPFFTRPPVRDDHGEAAAAIVPSWGADFDAEAVRAQLLHAGAQLCRSAASHVMHGLAARPWAPRSQAPAPARLGKRRRLSWAGARCEAARRRRGAPASKSVRHGCVAARTRKARRARTYPNPAAGQVFANERSAVIAGLPSVEDSAFFEAATAGPAPVDLDAMEREDGGAELAAPSAGAAAAQAAQGTARARPHTASKWCSRVTRKPHVMQLGVRHAAALASGLLLT